MGNLQPGFRTDPFFSLGDNRPDKKTPPLVNEQRRPKPMFVNMSFSLLPAVVSCGVQPEQ